MTFGELVVKANCGYIGINDELEISEGYDGVFPEAQPGYQSQGDWDDGPLSKEDMLKLADLMIWRWTRYRKAVEGAGE
jgi:hypothetical protein